MWGVGHSVVVGAGRRPPEVWSKGSPVAVRGCEHRPNKRLKLAAPAFRGSRRLCANELVPQGGVLAPAGARPAA